MYLIVNWHFIKLERGKPGRRRSGTKSTHFEKTNARTMSTRVIIIGGESLEPTMASSPPRPPSPPPPRPQDKNPALVPVQDLFCPEPRVVFSPCPVACWSDRTSFAFHVSFYFFKLVSSTRFFFFFFGLLQAASPGSPPPTPSSRTAAASLWWTRWPSWEETPRRRPAGSAER